MLGVDVLILERDLKSPANFDRRHTVGRLSFLFVFLSCNGNATVGMPFGQAALHLCDLPRNRMRALFSPPATSTIASATLDIVFVASAKAMQRPMRHASDTVFNTDELRTLSVVVGLDAIPTLEPISEHEARNARSTISSFGAFVMMMVFPSPESMTQGTSSPG